MQFIDNIKNLFGRNPVTAQSGNSWADGDGKPSRPDSLTVNLSPGHNFQTFRGFMDIMPNPDPVLKKQGNGKDVDVYQEILSDPQLYGAVENNRKAGVTSLLMYLDNPECSEDELDFFRKYFDKLKDNGTYETLMRYALDAPQYGRVVFGTVWEEVDGFFIPVTISPIPYKLSKFNYDGKMLVSDNGIDFREPDHPARFIPLVNKPRIDNPYGDPLLSKCFWNVKFKKDGFKMWIQFIEKYGMPWVKGSYDRNAIKELGNSEKEASEKLLNVLSNMSYDGVFVTPDGVKVDLMEASKTSSSDTFEALVRICDEQNTKLQLGHSGATESTSGDKLSNDTTATDVRKAVIDSDKKFPIMLMNTIIRWIHEFNFGGPEMPKFDLYAEEDVDQAQATRDATLVPVLLQSGLKFSADYLKKAYGFDDGDIAEAPVTASPVPAAKSRQRFGAFRNEIMNLMQMKDESYPDQDLIDRKIDDNAENIDVFDPITKAVMDYLNNCEDFDEAKKGLGDLLNEINSDDFAGTLTRVLFASDIVGRLSVKDEMEGLSDE